MANLNDQFFDSFSSKNGQGLDPITWTHTCSGSNRLLVVGIIADSTSSTVSAVTYNGVAMTLINSASAATDIQVFLYYLINPASGANTVSVDMDAAGTTGCVAVSLVNIDQTVALGASDIRAGVDAAATIFLSPEAGTILVDVIGLNVAGGTITSNTQKIRGSATVNNNNTGAMSTRLAVADDFYTNVYSNDNNFWAMVIAAFFPMGGSPHKITDLSSSYVRVGNGMSRNDSAT